MKIRGYWGQFDAPYVRVRFICTRFGINGTIHFLIDLGASSTMISESDAKRLKIDYAQLKHLRSGMTGIGGKAKTYLMEGIELYFEADEGSYFANTSHIFVTRHAKSLDPESRKLIPSLLGRDFLNQMALLTDYRQDLVLITDENLNFLIALITKEEANYAHGFF
jgi:hypothetical protein